MVEFGECILYKTAGLKGKDKMEVRWQSGVFLGVNDTSGEIRVGTSEGVTMARDMRRKSREEDRWQADKVKEIIGVPWDMRPNRRVEINVNVPTGSDEPVPMTMPEQEEPKARRARIDPADIADAGGYTIGCPGCDAMKKQKRPQPHSEG